MCETVVSKFKSWYFHMFSKFALDSQVIVPAFWIDFALNYLTLDFCLVNFQFTVTLRDLGQPSSRQASQTAEVTININRNEFSPLFFNSTYYATILETSSVGSSVALVSAQDQDTSVSHWENHCLLLLRNWASVCILMVSFISWCSGLPGHDYQ